jgi:hypothetical protein
MLAALGPAIGMVSPPNMTASLLVAHALGWLFVGAASCLLPRSWTPEADARQSKSPPHDLPPWVTEPAKPLLSTTLAVMVWVVFLSYAPVAGTPMAMPAMLVMILLLHSVLKFQAASQASRMLAGRRRSGELELLLTTPYDEDEILRGCLLELKRSLFWPALFALGVDLALLIFGWRKAWFGDRLGWAAAVMVEVIWLLVNLYSLSWVGLFLGLRLANPPKAASRAIFYVVLLPWALLICFAAPATLLVGRHRLGLDAAVPCAVILVIAVVFCNSFFTGWAINELRDRFRSWAARS